MWVKCYLNRRKLQRLLASAELPSEHPLEEQIKNSVKKKISVEQKMFRRDFFMFAKLTMQCYHKRDRRGILEHAMHNIPYILQARILEECFDKTAGDKTNGIMGYIR